MYGDTIRDQQPNNFWKCNVRALSLPYRLDVCSNQGLAFRSKSLRAGDPRFGQEAQDLEHHRGADERRVP